MRTAVRTISAALVSPLLLALVASLPALGSAAFLQWFVMSAAICVPLFLAGAAASHVVLRWKQWSQLKAYLGVMFVVSTFILLAARVAFLQWIFGNGGSEFHLGTQVIENGQFTLSGLVLLTAESMFGALWLSLAFGVFWVIAVRGRTPT